MDKVLIFGSSGFVGGYLSKELKQHEYQVWGSDLAPRGSDSDIQDSLDGFYVADILNEDEVQDIILKVEPVIVINLAAISSVGKSWKIPQKTMRINVEGAINILESVRKMKKYPKVLLIGSSEEYIDSSSAMNEDTPQDGNNPYGISKMAQEQIARIYRGRYQIPVYYVRAFNHTGIGQNIYFVLPSFCYCVAEIESSKRDGEIRVGNLSIERDFSDVRDVVRAYRMILEKGDPSRIYNIGSGKAYKLSDLLDYIISLSSREIAVVRDCAKIRVYENQKTLCDNTRIRSEIGWNPEHDIFETLKEMYQYYLAGITRQKND